MISLRFVEVVSRRKWLGSLVVALVDPIYPQPPDRSPDGVHCGYRPGPTRVTLPSRQDDGERQSASSCLLGLRGCASGCRCSCSGGGLLNHQLGVFCPRPSSTDSLLERVSGGPRRLHPSARTRCCTAVAAILSELWRLRLDLPLRGNSSFRDCLVRAQTPPLGRGDVWGD